MYKKEKKRKKNQKQNKTTTLFKVKLITLLENSTSDAFWNFNRKAEQPHFCEGVLFLSRKLNYVVAAMAATTGTGLWRCCALFGPSPFISAFLRKNKQKKNKTSCVSIFRVIFGGCNNVRECIGAAASNNPPSASRLNVMGFITTAAGMKATLYCLPRRKCLHPSVAP